MDIDPLSLPIGANPGKDRVIGFDELGEPIRKTAFGVEYSVTPTFVQGGSRIKPMAQALADDPMVSIGGAVKALGKGAWNAISAPGRAAAGQPVTYGDALDTMGMVTLGAMPFAKPQGALGANSFKAYHGSPHDFDRFSMDKIGTGEGAQAYGHGLYFAEAEDVADSYRQMGRPKNMWTAEEPDGWRVKYQTAGGQTITKRGFATEEDALNAAKGSMYEVQINADPDTFLDWDAPLSEQPQAEIAIGQYLESVLDQPGPINDEVFKRFESGTMTGADAARMVGENTSALRKAGIPGIKYKDAGSRGAGGSGTRNFVVFDDSLIEILRKYGLVPGMFGAGLYAAQQPSSNEELRNYLGGT